jgi:hypothetical protein
MPVDSGGITIVVDPLVDVVPESVAPSVPELTPTESSPHPTNQASAHANPSPNLRPLRLITLIHLHGLHRRKPRTYHVPSLAARPTHSRPRRSRGRSHRSKRAGAGLPNSAVDHSTSSDHSHTSNHTSAALST